MYLHEDSIAKADQREPKSWIVWLHVHSRLGDVAPTVAVAGFGLAWIALHVSESRGFVHPLLWSLGLVENSLALLFRRRKPLGALLSILAVFGIFQVEATTFLPIVVALFTVAYLSRPRAFVLGVAATVAVFAWHEGVATKIGAAELLSYALTHVAVVAAVVILGLFVKSRLSLTSNISASS